MLQLHLRKRAGWSMTSEPSSRKAALL